MFNISNRFREHLRTIGLECCCCLFCFKGPRQATYKESTGSSTHVSPGGSKPLINQPFPPEKNKKNSFGLCPPPSSFCHPSHPSANPSTSINLPRNTIIATPLLFSHSSLSGLLPWSFLCLLGPDAGEPQSLSVDQTSVQWSVTTGSWKAPGVKVVLGRVYVAYSSSLITRRHEFMCETNRIRRDYDATALSQSEEHSHFHS